MPLEYQTLVVEPPSALVQADVRGALSCQKKKRRLVDETQLPYIENRGTVKHNKRKLKDAAKASCYGRPGSLIRPP